MIQTKKTLLIILKVLLLLPVVLVLGLFQIMFLTNEANRLVDEFVNKQMNKL